MFSLAAAECKINLPVMTFRTNRTKHEVVADRVIDVLFKTHKKKVQIEPNHHKVWLSTVCTRKSDWWTFSAVTGFKTRQRSLSVRMAISWDCGTNKSRTESPLKNFSRASTKEALLGYLRSSRWLLYMISLFTHNYPKLGKYCAARSCRARPVKSISKWSAYYF